MTSGGRLFRKYVLWTMALVCGALLASGAIIALAIDPSQPATIYAGSFGFGRRLSGGTTSSVSCCLLKS